MKRIVIFLFFADKVAFYFVSCATVGEASSYDLVLGAEAIGVVEALFA